jgi:ElaB/YqjD/DUF883 family membrane-anchored ribosome-binding protein
MKVKDIAMDLNQVTGSASHVAGQVREAVGEFVDETKIQAEQVGHRASVASREAVAAVNGMVQQQPIAALLAAAVVGGLLTLMLTRR